MKQLLAEVLYLITKLQNLKAIHNRGCAVTFSSMLYLITKLQNLKAIHNYAHAVRCDQGGSVGTAPFRHILLPLHQRVVR